jgi:acylphosphatase
MCSNLEQPASKVRHTLFFSGHVQGVGFRYTTQRVARGFTLTGFVRNLRDGRVELVAEGSRAELDRFQRAVEAAMVGYVQETTVVESPASGEFGAFAIARS